MSRYLTPRTVFVITKFWTMGVTVFTFGVVLLLGVFRVAQCISNSLSELNGTTHLPNTPPQYLYFCN